MKYKDFENYEVFPYENKVVNIKRHKALKQRVNDKGYIVYRIYKDGKCYQIYAHRLYWECVYGEIPEGMEIDHINTIRDDNRLENLRIVTHRENMNNEISLETRKKVLNTDEYKEKRSKIMKGKFSGEKNPMYGKPRPEGGGTPAKPINVYKDGVLLATFPSINGAARALNLNDGNIYLCLRGIRKHTKGYTFGYA